MKNYQSGFGNEHATEIKPGLLPQGQNLPQKTPEGLFPEQISGSAFTAPNHKNLRTWVYRQKPSVTFPFTKNTDHFKNFLTAPFSTEFTSPNPSRWNPCPQQKGQNWLESIVTQCGNGNCSSLSGSGIHVYNCSQSMDNNCFVNHDGEFLIVLQQGKLRFETELGVIDAEPQEVVYIPRGIIFRVQLLEEHAGGYILENYGAPLEIPYRGPIGANGLVNPRDVKYPVAWHDESASQLKLVKKFLGSFSQCQLEHSPFNVLAWHGNYLSLIHI